MKRLLKRYRFKKNAIYPDSIILSPRSNCISQNKNNIRLGHHCLIFGTLQSQYDGKITIGDNTCIFNDSLVGSVCDIKIGDCVIISNNVKIYDNNNHPTDPDIRMEMSRNGFFGDAWTWRHADYAPVVIEDNVWIGERSTILKGVTVGRGSIIASNSVVTKDVPPYTIVAGNPARVVKKLRDEQEN